MGKDQKMGKATYPSLVGLDETSRIQQELYKKSIDSISSFDKNAKPLREIAKLIIERKN